MDKTKHICLGKPFVTEVMFFGVMFMCLPSVSLEVSGYVLSDPPRSELATWRTEYRESAVLQFCCRDGRALCPVETEWKRPEMAWSCPVVRLWLLTAIKAIEYKAKYDTTVT